MALVQGPVIGIPVALAAIPLGLLIDRHSRARLLIVVIVLSLLGSLFTAFSSNFGLLLVTRCLAGLMGLSTVPVVYSLLADLYAPAQRGRATMVVCVGQLAGISAAFAMGGALLAMTGPGPDGWRRAMLWLTAPLVPVAVLMLALRDPPRMGVAIANPSARQLLHELRDYLTVIGPLAVGIIAIETGVGAMLIWGAPMFSRSFALPPERVGTIMAVATLVSGILGPIVGGTLADLCQRTGGPRRTVAVLSVLAILSAPAGLFAFVPGVAAASVLLVVALTIALAVAVMGMILFTIVIPNEVRGLCVSVLIATNLLFAFAVGPVSVSLLAGAFGGAAVIGKALSVVCVTTSVLAAATFAFGTRYFPRVALGSE
jgi:MFS family permease